MLGLNLREVFQGKRLKWIAVELSNETKTGATQIAAKARMRISSKSTASTRCKPTSRRAVARNAFSNIVDACCCITCSKTGLQLSCNGLQSMAVVLAINESSGLRLFAAHGLRGLTSRETELAMSGIGVRSIAAGSYYLRRSDA